LAQYHEQYANDSEEIVGATENEFIKEISLNETERSQFGDFIVDFVAVIDLILKIDGLTWVIDFKTTSVDLPYLSSKLRRMAQLMGYQFIAQSVLPEVNGTFVYYHQLKASKSRKTGEYGETKIDFMKFPQVYSITDYEQWRKYVVWNAFKMKQAKLAGYPPEFSSCYLFNSACEYLPLCDHPKWDLERFLEMPGYVIVPDDRVDRVEVSNES
jgi:hypothetical protein